jgi:autoinducer 2-binding protein LuxP
MQAQFEAQVTRPEPPKLTRKLTSPISIAIIFPGLQASDYWRRTRQAFEARLKQAKVPYFIDAHFTQADALRLQENHIRRAMKKRPRYLIFTLNVMRHMRLVEQIIGRGDSKLIIQNMTTPMKAWEGTQPFLYVGFDHEIGSRLLAEEFLKRIGTKGHYALFYGPRGYVSQMRGDTFNSYIQQKSNLKMVASYYVGFNRQKARQGALELLTSQSASALDFIYACSTDIALGVADALQQTGKTGKILINGWGGGSAELEMLRNKTLDFTVMRMNDDSGVAMADAVIMDLNGNPSDTIPTVYSGQMRLVTKEMPETQLRQFTNQAFRYSK